MEDDFKENALVFTDTETGHIQEFDSTGMTEVEIRNHKLASAPLAHTLSSWQLTMMAIGTSIGSGLFISSGNDLKVTGPGGTIIGFFITGVMLSFMMHSMCEVSVRFPKMNLVMQSQRFSDDSVAFSMTWIYFLNYALLFPFELVSSAIIIRYWQSTAAQVNPTAWVLLFWFLLVSISFCDVSIYGYAESILSLIKVIAIVGFCIFGIVCTAGGGPDHHYYGTHYWYDPGSFNYATSTAVKNTMSVFISTAFAMGGIEMTAIASSESKEPHIALPRAVRQTFWRVVLFYLVSLTICFCLVPYTHPMLGTHQDGSASPFVLALKVTGISGLPSVMNVVILLSALAVANAAIYGSSRALAAISLSGGAPSIFGYIDRTGRPLVALTTSAAFGLIGFCVAAKNYQKAFDWLMAISAQAVLLVWGFICLNHILFRIAMKKQGRSLDEQLYTSPFGIWGSSIALAIILTILGLEFWIAIWPINGSPSAYNFFQTWLSLPIVLALFVGHKLWFRRKPIIPSSMDLMTDANIKTAEQEEKLESRAQEWKAMPIWKRLIKRAGSFIC